MKKVLLGTLAVLTLAACSKDEVIQQNPNDEITFSVVTNKAVSRAADGYCNKSLPGDFQVWAEVDGNNYFAQERYVKSGSTSTYTISGPVRYWPETNATKINFYAACNIGKDTQSNVAIKGWDKNTTATPASKVIEGYIIESTVANQKDLLYAVVADAKRPTGTEGKININFRHALSQIEFMAKNENPNIYVEISQVKVCQVNSKGDFTFPKSTSDKIGEHNENGAYPDPATDKVGTWANWSTLANYETTEFNPVVGLSERALKADGTFEPEVNSEGIETAPSKPAAASSLTVDDPTSPAQEYNSNTMYLLPQEPSVWNPTTNNTPGAGKGAYFLVKTKIWNVAAGDGKRAESSEIVLWGDTNGKDIAVPFPASTKWEPGKRYVYTFKFTTTGNGGYNPSDGEPVLIPIKLEVTVDDFVKGIDKDVEMTKP